MLLIPLTIPEYKTVARTIVRYNDSYKTFFNSFAGTMLFTDCDDDADIIFALKARGEPALPVSSL